MICCFDLLEQFDCGRTAKGAIVKAERCNTLLHLSMSLRLLLEQLKDAALLAGKGLTYPASSQSLTCEEHVGLL